MHKLGVDVTFLPEINLTDELALSLMRVPYFALANTMAHLLRCSSAVESSCIDCGVSMTEIGTDGGLGLFD